MVQYLFLVTASLARTQTHFLSLRGVFYKNIFILSQNAVVSTSPLTLKLFKMLSELGFQPIRDSFYYGYYGQFRVVIDKQDGYIYATKLCSDGGKNFYHWKESKVSKELVSTLQQAIDLDETQEP